MANVFILCLTKYNYTIYKLVTELQYIYFFEKNHKANYTPMRFGSFFQFWIWGKTNAEICKLHFEKLNLTSEVKV